MFLSTLHCKTTSRTLSTSASLAETEGGSSIWSGGGISVSVKLELSQHNNNKNWDASVDVDEVFREGIHHSVELEDKIENELKRQSSTSCINRDSDLCLLCAAPAGDVDVPSEAYAVCECCGRVWHIESEICEEIAKLSFLPNNDKAAAFESLRMRALRWHDANRGDSFCDMNPWCKALCLIKNEYEYYELPSLDDDSSGHSEIRLRRRLLGAVGRKLDFMPENVKVFARACWCASKHAYELGHLLVSSDDFGFALYDSLAAFIGAADFENVVTDLLMCGMSMTSREDACGQLKAHTNTVGIIFGKDRKPTLSSVAVYDYHKTKKCLEVRIYSMVECIFSDHLPCSVK
jgi:hypothetical protein